MATLVIKQVRSAIGKSKRQKLTLQALGLRKMHQVVEHTDSPSILGMVKAVNHLIQVEEK